MAHIRARDAASTADNDILISNLTELGAYHTIELPDGSVIPGLHPVEQLRRRVERFHLPEDLAGKRVLDIGAWDGWFSFEMERRGASVTAVDIVQTETFRRAHQLRNSRVEFVVADVLDLSPDRIGRFDIVLFLGVLYHVRHPLLALEKICALTTDMACVESFVIDDGDLSAPPLMEFYETDELLGRLDNWVGPNTSCLMSMCRAAGFVRVEFGGVMHQHAHVLCRRHWAPEPAESDEASPVITGVMNNRTGDVVLETAFDDYLVIWFKTGRTGLRREDMMPEVGGFGVQPMYVGQDSAGNWHVNCRIPPGVARGTNTVCLRTAGSRRSNALTILVDPTAEELEAMDRAEARSLEIFCVTDGRDWTRNRVKLVRETFVSVWVSGIPDIAARSRVSVEVGGQPVEVLYLSAPDEQNLRQINVRLPAETTPGAYELTVRYGQVCSAPAPLEAIAG